jgi:hypothetical protein
MKTTTIGIVVFTLVIISLSTFGTTHAYFNTRQVTGSHLISTWQSSFWTQTTQADFLAGVPVNIDTTSSPGDVKLAWRNISPMIYATSGNATTTFRQYNVSNNTWNSLRNTPGSISTGGAVADDDLNYLYVLRGSGQRNFYRYSIPNNTWSSMTSTPAAINSGGALTYVNQTSLYALRGGGQRNFYRYSIPLNTWSSMTVTPAAINSGGALVYSGGNYLYALRGNGTTDFYRYSIPLNTWSSMTVTPAAINSGGALVYSGGNYLYALRGNGTTDFYRYSIPLNTWSSMTVTPAAINSGGALVSDNGNNIYAFNGSSQKFWVYNIFANTWNDTVVSDPPDMVGWGGSLTYVAGSSGYISRGTLASPVNDTRTAGVKWDLLLWDSTTVAGTNLTFEVRASNTSFTKTATLPAWQQSGWPSPVNSGLPSGRYIQWRATLSTSNSSRTPILNEVRISYS